MVLSIKQKKILSICLIVFFVAVVLTGIGLGVYFIMKDEAGLTQRQKKFGYTVNASVGDASINNVNASILPSEINLSDAIIYTGDYIVTESEQGEYKIYSLVKNEIVSINSMITYNKVEEIYDNVVVVSMDGTKKLINLNTGNLIAILSNASFDYKNGYIVLRSTDGKKLNYSEDFSSTNNVLSVLLDAKNVETKVKVLDSHNCINVTLSKNYFFVTTKSKTSVYCLENFSLVKEFENDGKVTLQGSNTESKIDGQFYYMNQLVQVYELSKNSLLVETSKTTDKNDYLIESKLYGGLDQRYYKNYKILDVASNKLFDLSTEGKVLKPIEINFGENYFAVLSHNVVDKKIVSQDDVVIKYYELGKKDGVSKLYNIVSFDYTKYGKIVGFNGEYLLTSGGTSSTVLDFDGKEASLIKMETGDKLSMQNYNKVVIVSSLIGQKKVLKENGDILVDGDFIKISPFSKGYAIAKDVNNYYLISTKGEKKLINNFAGELEDYVFMGIGLYFTNSGDLYDVYSINGDKLYSKTKLTISYDSIKNKLLIKIKTDTDYLLEVNPVNKLVLTGTQNNFSNLENIVIKNFAGQQSEIKEAFASEISGVEKETSIDVNSNGGYGSKNFNFKIDLLTVSFKAYLDLSNIEKAFLPQFDDLVNGYYVVSETEKYSVDGIAIIGDTYFDLAIIKLTKIGSSDNYYMLSIGFSDTYLYNLTATSSLNSVSTSMKYSNGSIISSAYIDASSDVISAPKLSGYGVMYNESTMSKERIVNYSSLGREGGLVLVSSLADSITLDFTLYNIYYGNFSDEVLFDYQSGNIYSGGISDKYNVSMSDFTAEITATEGYLITSYNIDGNYGDVLTSSVIVYISSIDSFSISLSMIESYSKLDFVDHDDSLLFTEYYFYGYGSDVSSSRNPAYFGFDNFDKKTSVDVVERTGYTFDGYSLNATPVVDETGVILPGVSFSMFDITDVDLPQTFRLKADYTPNTYTIFFHDGISVLSGYEQEVVYDSELGYIFPRLEMSGYTFTGWFDTNDASGGNEYNEESIYQVAGDITLYARWDAEVYTVSFYSNMLSYQTGNNHMSKVYFKEPYDTFSVNDEFSDGLRKDVVYRKTYGDLPELIGYNQNNALGANKERYVFDGWFASSDINNRGDQIVSSTPITTVNPVVTLFAHYHREVYEVELVNDNEKGLIVVTGELAEPDSNGIFTANQAEKVTVSISPIEGVYVSQIKIISGSETYIYNGNWDNGNPNNYSVSYIAGVSFKNLVNNANDNINVVNSGFNVNLELYLLEDTTRKVEISYIDKLFKTEFKITSEDTGIINGSEGPLTILNNAYNSNSGEIKFESNKNSGSDKYFISKAVIDGRQIDFDVSYNDSLDKNEVVQTSTGVDTKNVSLSVVYNADSTYSYIVNISSIKENHLIEITLSEKQIRTSVSSVNGVLGGNGSVNITKDGSSYVSGQESVISSKDTVTYKITRSAGTLFTNFKLKIGNGSYEELVSVVNTVGGNSVNQSFNILRADKFPQITGTNVVVHYNNSNVDEIIILINNMTSDVSFEVGYVAYQLLQVDLSSTSNGDESSFDFVVLEGETGYVGNNLDDLSVSKSEVGKVYSYLLIGFEKTITKIKLTVDVTSETSYKINSEATSTVDSSKVEISPTLSEANIYYNYSTTFVVVSGVVEYTIIFDENDDSALNGSSPAVDVFDTSKVKFGKPFGDVITNTSRQGYIFEGWTIERNNGMVKILSDTVLDLSLYNQLNKDESNRIITLYALWSNIEYNVSINKNDSAQGKGSTEASGNTDGFTIIYDNETSFAGLPLLARVGYNFNGYNVTADSVSPINILNYSTAGSSDIDDENKTITLYAVWIAKTFTLHFEQNKNSLPIAGDVGFDFVTVPFNNKQVTFDRAVGEIPVINTVSGYTFVGFYDVVEYNLVADGEYSPVFGSTMLESSTTISESSLVYRDVDGDEVDIDSVSEFYVFAHYTFVPINVTISNGGTNAYVDSGNHFDSYDYEGKTPNFINNDRVLAIPAGQYVLVDHMTMIGNYVSQINFNWVDGSGVTQSNELEFTWETRKSLLVNGASVNENQWIIASGFSDFTSSVQFMILPYNKDGLEDSNNVVTDAFRVIFVVEAATKDFTVMITESKQFFDITYYGSHDVVNPLGKTQIDYGQELTEKDTQKIYVEGKKSIGYWYYCDYDESTNSVSETEYEMVAGIGSEVYGNEYVICNYVSSLKQSVNFNYWDITLNNGLGGYSESIEINSNYILYPDKVSDENFDLNGFKFNEETGKYSINDFGGRIVKLPTPASELWPTGTFFAGYVISDSAPASGYFTLDAFDSLPKFDNTVMVEEEFTVYAVYEEMRFNLSVISGVARVDLSFGEILPDGTVDLFDKQDVYVIGLTIGQKAIIDSAQNKEVGLREALQSSYLSIYNSAPRVGSGVSVSGSAYYIAVIFKTNESGQRYAYKVSNIA